jgi:hypothetical protein
MVLIGMKDIWYRSTTPTGVDWAFLGISKVNTVSSA